MFVCVLFCSVLLCFVLFCFVCLYVCLFVVFFCASCVCFLRSGRERGVHERALKSGVCFPCPVTWIMVPMKISADDEGYELVQWPVLLPDLFVS